MRGSVIFVYFDIYINFMEKKEKDLRKHAEERQPQKKFNVYSMDSIEKGKRVYIYR